jgi:hypothetical protein
MNMVKNMVCTTLAAVAASPINVLDAHCADPTQQLIPDYGYAVMVQLEVAKILERGIAGQNLSGTLVHLPADGEVSADKHRIDATPEDCLPETLNEMLDRNICILQNLKKYAAADRLIAKLNQGRMASGTDSVQSQEP